MVDLTVHTQFDLSSSLCHAASCYNKKKPTSDFFCVCSVTTVWAQLSFLFRSVSLLFFSLSAPPLQAAKDIKDRYSTQPSIASLLSSPITLEFISWRSMHAFQLATAAIS